MNFKTKKILLDEEPEVVRYKKHAPRRRRWTKFWVLGEVVLRDGGVEFVCVTRVAGVAGGYGRQLKRDAKQLGEWMKE